VKLFISISILLLLLASCSSIYFQEVQPKGGDNLTEMPEELFGIWQGDSEGWKIDKNGFTNIDYKTDTLDNIIDTVYTITPLSDSTRIYRTKDFYVLNLRDNSQYWEIVVIRSINKGDIYFYYISDPEIFIKIKGIKLERANYYIDGELRTVKTVNPDAKTSLKFDSAVFSGQMKSESFRKALKSITPTIFGKDGKIYVPENDSIENK
jgi:hypothetical protein